MLGNGILKLSDMKRANPLESDEGGRSRAKINGYSAIKRLSETYKKKFRLAYPARMKVSSFSGTVDY